MNRGRGAALAWLSALLLLLASCGLGQRRVEFEPGETVEAYWFDFTVEEWQQADSWQGRRAEDGFRLVVCTLAIRSTFDSTIPMGRGDFALLWEGAAQPDGAAGTWSGMEGVYPLPAYAEGQLPNAYELDGGESVRGQLVFQVPDTVTRAALMFEEYYADGASESDYTVGDHYLVWLELGDGPEPAEEG